MPFDLRRFLRYCVAGGFGAAVDIGLLYLLVARGGMDTFPLYPLAVAIAFSVATLANFSISATWVFADRSGSWRSKLPRFFVVTIGGAILNELIIIGLVETVDWPIMGAKVLSTGVVAFYNFAASNAWAFRDRPKQ